MFEDIEYLLEGRSRGYFTAQDLAYFHKYGQLLYSVGVLSIESFI
jgi:hypothetical protein